MAAQMNAGRPEAVASARPGSDDVTADSLPDETLEQVAGGVDFSGLDNTDDPGGDIYSNRVLGH